MSKKKSEPKAIEDVKAQVQGATECVIIVPEGMKVNVDAQSGARYCAFAFRFLDGSHGAMTICRVKDEPWLPYKSIKGITINFNEN